MAEDVTGGFNAKEQFGRMTFDGRKLENRVHLFTGQFVGDWLTHEDMARTVKEWGYDGVGMVTWGPSGIDVPTAVGPEGKEYLKKIIQTLSNYNVGVSTISDHLASQALSAAIIDEGLLSILPSHVKAKGTDRESIHLSAALHMMDTGRVTERFREVAKETLGAERQQELYNPTVIPGFTGSPIWHTLAMFPPVSDATIERGFQEVAYRIARVLDVYRDTGNRFALETHPGEIAFDGITALRIADTINRGEFGFNGDSSHSVGRGWDYLKYLDAIAARGNLFSTHLKGAGENPDGLGGAYRSHQQFGNPTNGWDFKSLGRGTQDEGAIIYKLADLGYAGAFENEWEDAQIEKAAGAVASVMLVRGYVNGDESLVIQALRKYENPANYQRADFEASF